MRAQVQFPKPRYSIEEALSLLNQSRARFYERVREGKVVLNKDGRRSYITHENLLLAAEGDGPEQRVSAVG